MECTTSVADQFLDLADRRQILLKHLAQELGADVGHWASARGRLESERYLVMGFSSFGYTDEQLALMNQMMLDPDISADMFRRLQTYMESNTRSDGGWSTTSKTELADVIGNQQSAMYRSMQAMDVEHWLQVGKFCSDDTFSLIVLGRAKSQPNFSDADSEFLDFAFTHIRWLHANAFEPVPQSSIEALSARQRGVAFLLMAGLSRKEIAKNLAISPTTVDDHIKAIYRHFNIGSATELAALFIRNC
jgi:DNA-binding CsgD family transcriptional regulator